MDAKFIVSSDSATIRRLISYGFVVIYNDGVIAAFLNDSKARKYHFSDNDKVAFTNIIHYSSEGGEKRDA